MIAFYGYDGFLYSIGYLAGWIVALFVIAEPLKRLGRFTFADALDSRFHSRGIKLAAAISTLVVSLFYLIPQMVGAGALITPLLGLPHVVGVLLVGVVVIIIVVTAGMVSTTWVQFIKGSLLVLFCFVLTILILRRGLIVNGGAAESPFADRPRGRDPGAARHRGAAEDRRLGRQAVHAARRIARPGASRCGARRRATASRWLTETQRVTVTPGGARLVDGVPQGTGEGQRDLRPVGHVVSLTGADRSDVDGPARPDRVPRHAQQGESSSCGARSAIVEDGRRGHDGLLPEGRPAATTCWSPAPARRSPACAAPSCSTSSTSCR